MPDVPRTDESVEQKSMTSAFGRAAAGMKRNLVICEKTGRWATRLRPLLVDAQIQLLETRALSDVVDYISQPRGTAFVLEAREDNLVCVLETIPEVRRLTSVAIIVLTKRPLSDHQWIMRELGADYVACSPAELPTAAKLVRKFAVNNPVPANGLSFTERIRQRLPWQR